MFDVECFIYFNKVLEFFIFLIVVLVLNWGVIIICGVDDLVVVYGIFFDFLFCFFIIFIYLYEFEEIKRIVWIWLIIEGV